MLNQLKICKLFFICLVFSTKATFTYSQSLVTEPISTSVVNQQTITKSLYNSDNSIKDQNKKDKITGKSFLLPGSFVLTGSLLFESRFNKEVQKKITPVDETRKIHLDDYLMYVPSALTIGLEISGLKGKHNAIQTSVIFGISNVIVSAVVIPTKHFSHELRPDSSNYASFPSGHTSTAFASAEIMRMEYGETHPWLAVAGYMMATTTGYLRMYNNKHWISDVITGAGIGIASTRLSYLIYNKLSPHFQRKKSSKNSNTFIMPVYQNNQLGFNLVKRV